MSDKSPKALRQQAFRKQTRSNTADQKKQQAMAAKQGAFKKR